MDASDRRDDIPDEEIAGLPSARSNTVTHVVAGVILSLPFVALFGYALRECGRTTFADTLAEIPVAGMGQPAERSLALRAKSDVVFALSTSYEYSGNPVVMLDVLLLRAGAEVAKTSCNMKGFTGIGAKGIGGSTWYGDAGWTCSLEVPDGGSDALRVNVRKAGPGSLTLHHTSVIVKRP